MKLHWHELLLIAGVVLNQSHVKCMCQHFDKSFVIFFCKCIREIWFICISENGQSRIELLLPFVIARVILGQDVSISLSCCQEMDTETRGN